VDEPGQGDLLLAGRAGDRGGPGVVLDPEPVPEPGGLQRVDRQHGVSGGDQRPHPWAPIGLDAHQYFDLVGVLAGQLTDDRVQPGHPGHALGQPGLGQAAAGGVHHLHIVVVFGPVVSHQQSQRSSRSRYRSPCAACGRTISDLIKQCSRPRGRARHPISDQLSRPTGRGTVFPQDSRPRKPRVLTCQRLPPGVCRMAYSQN
jgi:hypothetical protein